MEEDRGATLSGRVGTAAEWVERLKKEKGLRSNLVYE
jgi:hypothetical protein